MRIFKFIQKAFSGVIAGVMIALGCISTIPASAAAAKTPVPGSALQYDVSASIVTVDPRTGEDFEAPKIKVSVTTTVNPGFYYLSLFVKHDSQCKYNEGMLSCSHESVPNAPALICTANDDGEYSNFMFRVNRDIKEKFWVDFYFSVSNLNIKAHEFTVGTKGYHSNTENIHNYDVTVADLPATAIVKDDTKNIEYFLGDVDNDEDIDLDDSYYVLNLLDANGNSSISVSRLNNSLASGSTKFRERCPMLICAEVADVDNDNSISKTDSSLIISYYASVSVGKDPVSEIGKQRVKTVSL